MSDSVSKLSVVDQVENASLTLEQFLVQAEQRAYRTALLTTRKSADALDIVQDAMLQLVQHYRERPAQEWPLVFQRILQHRIMDWHRQQARSKKWFWQSIETDDDSEDFINQVVDEREQDPAELLSRASDIKIVLNALENLPVRQRQAFMLRAWEGFDVQETATAMECSQGSVKTHYFRALQTLRGLLLANA
jgi:RNA polymerase sigma-70 factor (ECF subfamily)